MRGKAIEFFGPASAACSVGRHDRCGQGLTDSIRGFSVESWNAVADPDNTTSLRDVAVFSADSIWVVSYGGPSDSDRGMSRWNGTSWGAKDNGGLNADRINAIWHAGPDLVVTGRSNGRINVFNGSAWARPANGSGMFLDVDGSDANNIWAVGGSLIYRSTNAGGAFSPLTSTVETNWRGVAALSNEAVWLVGDGGVVAFWNGTGFDAQTSGTQARLNAVLAKAADDVYAVGENGTVLHYDGTEWSSVNLGFSVDDDLYNIDMSPDGNLYIVGENERIIVGTVPEPASLLMAGVGAALMLCRRR